MYQARWRDDEMARKCGLNLNREIQNVYAACRTRTAATTNIFPLARAFCPLAKHAFLFPFGFCYFIAKHATDCGTAYRTERAAVSYDVAHNTAQDGAGADADLLTAWRAACRKS